MPEVAKRPRRNQMSVMLDPDVEEKLREIARNGDEGISDVINKAVRSVHKIPRGEAPNRDQ
jgi:predicted transcriptional regulator